MTGIITSITSAGDVTLVSVNHFPASISDIADLFSRIAKEGIIVDMISQTTVRGDSITLSFTVSDQDLNAILLIAGGLRSRFPSIRCDVSSGNCKFSFFGDKMKEMSGVFSNILNTLKDSGIDVKMITTSEVDISLLIDKEHEATLLNVCKEVYGL